MADRVIGFVPHLSPVTGTNRGHCPEREEKRREEESRGEKTDATWSRQGGWHVNDGARERWEKAYPGLDIEAQLRRMDAWLRANPAKARYRNWERFVTGWLSREGAGGTVDTRAIPSDVYARS